MEFFDYLRNLFVYDHWANREALQSLRAAGTPPPRSHQLMAHILGTEYVWLSRIQQQPSPLAVWPDLSLAECDEHIDRLAGVWSDYLASAGAEGITRTVSYRNSKGESWSSSIQDILMHVVMHSAYHRGQIATAVRAAGYTPAYTDFIHAVRQQMMK
jgi:uncharacterized damage-inducible protein DinB